MGAQSVQAVERGSGQETNGGALGRPDGNAPSGVKRTDSTGTIMTIVNVNGCATAGGTDGIAACVASKSQ